MDAAVSKMKEQVRGAIFTLLTHAALARTSVPHLDTHRRCHPKQHTKLLCRGPPGYLGVWTTTTMPSAVLQAELLTSTCLYEKTCHMVNCVALAHYHAHSSLD